MAAKFQKVVSFFKTTLAQGMTDIQTTMTLNDSPGGAIEYPAWASIEPDSENKELVYLPSAPTANVYSSIVRGLDPEADVDTAGSGFNRGHAANVNVVLSMTHRHWNNLVDVMDGTAGTGAPTLRIGNDADENITIYAQNADGSKPFVRYEASSNKWLISNDGTSTYDITSGGSGLTRGLGIDIVASAITLDVRSSGGLRNDQGTGSQQCDVDPAIVARLDTANTWAAVQTITADRLQITTDPDSANDALRSGLVDTYGITTGEAIDGSTTPQVVAIKTSDGLLYKADANDNTLVKAFGFVTTNALITTTPRVQTSGVVTFPGATLVKNSLYYVQDTAGTIGVTPSTTCSIPVGIATSTSTLKLLFGKKIAYGTISHTAAGAGTQDVTTTIGFQASLILIGILSMSESVGGRSASGMATYFGTTRTSSSGVNPTGNTAVAVTNDNIQAYVGSFDPIVQTTSAFGNRVSATLTMNAVDETSFTTRIVTTQTAGSGGTVTGSLRYVAFE